MVQPEIPGAGPTEMPAWLPEEWITTTGTIRWGPNPRGGKCEDCLRCIADFLTSKAPAGARPPGLARPATWSRRQARRTHIFCEGHGGLRRAKEQS